MERLCWSWGLQVIVFSPEAISSNLVFISHKRDILIFFCYFFILFLCLFRFKLGRGELLLGPFPNPNFGKEAQDEEKRMYRSSGAGGSLARLETRKRVSGARQSGQLGDCQRVREVRPDTQRQRPWGRVWVLFQAQWEAKGRILSTGVT